MPPKWISLFKPLAKKSFSVKEESYIWIVSHSQDYQPFWFDSPPKKGISLLSKKFKWSSKILFKAHKLVTLTVLDEKKRYQNNTIEEKRYIETTKIQFFFLFLFSLLSHRTSQIDLIIEPLKRLENGIFVAFPLPLTTSQFGFETRGTTGVVMVRV